MYFQHNIPIVFAETRSCVVIAKQQSSIKPNKKVAIYHLTFVLNKATLNIRS